MRKQQKQGNSILIKNMVCQRCIKTVRSLVEESGADIENIELGVVEIAGELSLSQKTKLSEMLKHEGFELLDDKTSKLISQIKNLIIREIHLEEGRKQQSMNFSTFLAKELGYDYSFLSKMFSAVAGMTIEKFIIAQKIERVKEWLTYNEMSISEIAWRLDYSSSQHLSNQFRQVTGMSPNDFRNNHEHHRRHLDHV
jgi:AraC-like DNA-binding protein